MRKSLDSLAEMIQDDVVSTFQSKEENWFEDLNATQWLYHTRLVLCSSMQVALSVRDGEDALVHCSDGWDRTSQ